MSKSQKFSPLRIIGGQWRGRKVSFDPVPTLRPTPDRVRETLFNWLQGKIAQTRCLDLFAGSGILSFEALSRGAQHVTLLENDPAAHHCLSQQFAHLKAPEERIELLRHDAFEFIKQSPQNPYDLIFIDPPFATDQYDVLHDLILENRLLAPEGLIYVETAQAIHLEKFATRGLSIHRQGRAGQIFYGLLTHAS